MVLFFDICDYTSASVVGCNNNKLSYNEIFNWIDIKATAIATRDAMVKAVGQLKNALTAADSVSACTGYMTAFQTITGITTDSRYVTFWDLAENNMIGLTPQIYNDYVELINEVMCAYNEFLYYFSGQEITTFWSYPESWKENYWGIACCPLIQCGDNCISLSGALTTDLTEVDSVEEFSNVISSELIDVKNRQSISAYPTLKMLYERYRYNSTDFSNYQSSQFDYIKMDDFGQSVGGYWVDLIEQVVPATTIWDSTYVYRNTVFDQQKFPYKRNGITPVDNSKKYPFSAISNNFNVEVITETLNNGEEGNLNNITTLNTYNSVWTMQWTSSPEFLGTVQGDPDDKNNKSWNYFYNRL